MVEEIEVGDLVFSPGYLLYGVVAGSAGIDPDRIMAPWKETAQEALDSAAQGSNGWIFRRDLQVITKRRPLPAKPNLQPPGTRTCLCKTADLWRAGCKCGAIVPYAQRAM